MTRQLCIEFPNAFYHVCSRGLNRQTLFYDVEDFKFFLFLCNSAKSNFEMICHAFCLMNNHYHLYLQTTKPNLSRLMKFINENYARYFLKKYPQYAGHVFQGRYKRKLVQDDLYSQQLVKYIHLNPVAAGLVERAEDWLWSSYRCYLGLQPKNNFLEINWLLNQYSNDIKKAQKNLMEFTLQDLNFWNPDDIAHGNFLLGSENFHKQIIENYINSEDLTFDIQYSNEFIVSKNFTQEFLIKTANDLPCSQQEKQEFLTYLLKEYTNLTLVEISSIVNKKPKTVSRSVIRVKKKIQEDQWLKELLSL